MRKKNEMGKDLTMAKNKEELLKQKKAYPKQSYTIFTGWLLTLTAVAAADSVSPRRIAGLDSMKSFGLILYVMLDILFLIIYATQRIYWIDGVTYERASSSTEAGRKRYALCHFAIFLTATAVYLIYCFVPELFRTYTMTQDLVVMCGILCIAATAAGRIGLPE